MDCYNEIENLCQEMKGKEQMEANQNDRSREMKRALAVKLALQGYVYRGMKQLIKKVVNPIFKSRPDFLIK